MRLQLRPFVHTDAPLIVEYLNDPLVTQYLSSRLPSPYTLTDAFEWIETGCHDQQISRAIEVDGKFCGSVGAYLNVDGKSDTVEIGYWLGKRYWGQGIAIQVVEQFTLTLFNRHNIKRIINPVSAANIASIRVMEKSGYQLEKEIVSNGITESLYASYSSSSGQRTI